MKRNFALIVALTLALAVLATSAFAQNAPATAKSADARLFPLEELRPGMKGVGWTVFAGTEPEEFGVEILGVLPGFPAPRQSAIIARLTGERAEKTGVFAGMSGSPVYIDGRLVGAVAFSFPFSKEPIAGITPIQQMIDIFEHGAQPSAPARREPHSVSFTQLAA